MNPTNLISFDDTSVAFSYKSNQELNKANLIFTVVNYPFLSKVATSAVKTAFAFHLPVRSLIRATVFEHFCGGETIEQSEQTIRKLAGFHVGTILDYSVEGAKSEEGFDKTAEEIISTVEKAKKDRSSIPFCVFKLTGLADMELLEKVQSKKPFTHDERSAFERVKERVYRICSRAFESDVPILIDAEDSWIQGAIDSLAYVMMAEFNHSRPIVHNTFQMYRADMLTNLKVALRTATEKKYYLGVKLVRGAYMEKERSRALKLGYPDPINADKAATDELFNQGLSFCLENIEKISLVCGSHNEFSNQFLTDIMSRHGIKPDDKRIWFSQLLGMSDNISFNLAKAGYNVAKYVPYGPVEAVMPYLLRRAAENTSVAGQSSRELKLIRIERSRRKNGHPALSQSASGSN
jgi:proline dehydrogenase